ncbi:MULTISPECIES: ABC transporter ATP-binding protein [unclassified Nitratiruptor]|uniref:ABC transporter ATP-binding protein n=1 Tax=unclassified Nitratiruptor TaxID=2624044 RepID=UPI0019155380|nr:MULTISPECIES: ABC transporter ATP-binding protein [unclassified Nitratiruptor]BCD60973.1 putative ABC transport system ATP-binding protein [Nitratiruptor sp. YY08-10]BCD64905.1 putative ABC transport system ATP-binding protein [Nitratiruptor sp. YY08-14]
MLIECKHIIKKYRTGDIETTVLKDVSFCVEQGEFVAIMGSSGSGKSTLLYILGCLDKPSMGEYRINGQDVANLSDDELSHLRNSMFGFIFQAFYLIPYLTILDNVLVPTLYAKTSKSKEDAKALLEKLQLLDRIDFYPEQLSGGQKQRVAIARALINNPQIILADEPTGQLDTKNATIVMEILKNLNKEGRTVIVVTHDENMARYAQRIIRIQDGQILST